MIILVAPRPSPLELVLRGVEGLLALLLIVCGVALLSVPAALIVAGVLLAVDRATS